MIVNMTFTYLIAQAIKFARFFLDNPENGPSHIHHQRLRNLISGLPKNQKKLGIKIHGSVSVFDKTLDPLDLASEFVSKLTPIVAEVLESDDVEVRATLPVLQALQEDVQYMLDNSERALELISLMAMLRDRIVCSSDPQ